MSFGDIDNPDEIKAALRDFKKSEIKAVVKSAIKEWLDEQAAKVGRWSIQFMAMAALGALAYFILTNQGWVHK